MKKIDSLQDFSRQVEYYVDVAADFRSDFVVFPLDIYDTVNVIS